jgi:hypothetical protein
VSIGQQQSAPLSLCTHFISVPHVSASLLQHFQIEQIELGIVSTVAKLFKPRWGRWILSATKICSTTSFTGEVKPAVPCHKVFITCYRILLVRTRYVIGEIQWPFLCHVSPTLLLYVCWELWGMNQESLEIRWGCTIHQKVVEVQESPCAITPRTHTNNRPSRNSCCFYIRWYHSSQSTVVLMQSIVVLWSVLCWVSLKMQQFNEFISLLSGTLCQAWSLSP